MPIPVLFISILLGLASCATADKDAAAVKAQKLPPQISQPKYRTVWIPDKVEGDHFEEGHRIYIIEGGGQWIVPNRM